MTTERIRLPRKLAKSVSGGVLAEAGRLHPVGAVSATLNMLPLSRVTMTLAEDDLPMQLHDLVEVYGQNGSIGVYRVTKITNTYRKNRRVELAHGLDVFSDATFTAAEDFSGTVATFLQKVVNAQTQTIGGVKYWQLGTCADTRPWNKDIKYDNLMECLTEIAKTEEDYMFTFDQSTFPWTLNFIVRDSAVLSEFRLSRNVENCQVTLDDSDLCTKLYLSIDTTTTTADGDTTTTTHELHEDTAAQAVWGVVVKTAGIKAEDVPDKAAWVSQYFSRHAQPALQINIDGWEFNRLTGETLDQMHLGRICRVALPDYNTTFEERIVSLSYPDLLRSPKRVTASLANKRQKAEGAFSDLSSQSSKAASTARENSKKIQNNKTSSTTEYNTIVRRVSTVEGDIETIEGTGVFQNSERITQVAGKFTVDGSGNVHVIDGSNLYLGEGQGSLAVYKDGDITAAFIASQINDGTATIQGNHINIQANTDFSATAAKATAADDWITTYEGTGIYQNRNAINLVAGKFTVDSDGKLHVVNGSGLYLDDGTTSYGVYTSGNLTAGAIIQKINGTSQSGTILANKLDVNATDVAAWGAYTNSTLTGGILVQKLNDNTTTTQILGSRVNVQATDLASWGVYTDGTLTAGIIVDKINGGSATIAASKVNLTGYLYVGNSGNFTGSIHSTNGNITAAGQIGGASLSGGYITLDGEQLTSYVMSFMSNSWTVASDGNISLDHYHAISCSESNGVVTITQGAAQATAGSDSFNIADTRFYKDGRVSAWNDAVATVRINNSDSGAGDKTVNLASGGSVTVYAQAKAGASASSYSTYGTVTVNAEAVTIDSVNGSQGTTWGTYYIPITMTATASNGATGSNTINANASGVYTAGETAGYNTGYTEGVNDGYATGAAAVTISSVTGTPGTADTDHIIAVTLSATASNGATGSGSVSVDASGVYSDGEDAGYTDGYAEGVNDGYSTGYSAGYSAGYAAAPVNPTISQCYVSSFSVSRVAKYGDGYEVTGSVSIRVNFSNGTHTTYGPYSVRDVA